MSSTPIVGVLALQGDVAEHGAMLTESGVRVRHVKSAEDLAGISGLVIPGGESTTIGMLAQSQGLVEPIRQAISQGLPTLGTCAGLIFLANRVHGAKPGQSFIGMLDVTVRRNAFGRQVDSFEQLLSIEGLGEPFPAVFIRAPWIEEVGGQSEVLASIKRPHEASDRVVMVRQGNILATSFHPELTRDNRIHQMLCEQVAIFNRRGD